MNRVTRITIAQAAARLGITHKQLIAFITSKKFTTYHGNGNQRKVEWSQLKKLWKEST